MACYDTSPYTCTFDSGGAGSLPGGGNPDYTSVSTWESASDNDLSGYSGPVILSCYDSQDHNLGSGVTIQSATNTSETIYRKICSASACATPFAGKDGTGANFYGTANGGALNIVDTYTRVVDICITNAGNTVVPAAGILITGNNTKIINVVSHNCSNSGAGAGHGIFVNGITAALIYNCICYSNDQDGIRITTTVAGGYIAALCCTCFSNGTYGIESSYASAAAVAWNNYCANNSSGDFSESNWDSPSGWNASKDATSDLGGTAGDNYKNSLDLFVSGDLDADGLATADDLYATGGAGDNYGRNPYDDVTGTYDFDNFLKNDGAGEAISRLDIRGTARPSGTTADVSWNVGASQAVASSAINLVVPDSASASTADGVELTQYMGTTDSVSASTNDAVILTGQHILTLFDGVSASAIDAAILTAASLEQEGFRWRADDGDEDEATWLAAQDTSINLSAGDKARIRFIINSNLDYKGAAFQLEYKKPSESVWQKVVS